MSEEAKKEKKNNDQNQILEMMEYIFNLIKEAHQAQESRLGEIGQVHMQGGQEYTFPIVHLWAGVGVDNPLTRIKYYRNRCELLMKLLDNVYTKKGQLTESELLEIETTLKAFRT